VVGSGEGAGSSNLTLGGRGERAAAAAYESRGYRVVAANWRCPLGEIDLILARAEVIVFCEVKTRRGSSLGGPFEAVTATKQRRLRTLARAYLVSTEAGRDVAPLADGVRFDVASVTLGPEGRPQVHVFEDAF
jgi:putative endonuclease